MYKLDFLADVCLNEIRSSLNFLILSEQLIKKCVESPMDKDVKELLVSPVCRLFILRAHFKSPELFKRNEIISSK
jgi:hypothetical protein